MPAFLFLQPMRAESETKASDEGASLFISLYVVYKEGTFLVKPAKFSHHYNRYTVISVKIHGTEVG